MVRIDLGELREDAERNRKERLDFVTLYARWVKRTPNRIWSRQQKRMIDDVIKCADRTAMEGVKVA